MHPSIDTIKRVTAYRFGTTAAQLNTRKRIRSVSWPRFAAMYFAREFTRRSLPEIGRLFGDYDHTTVLHACRRVEEIRLLDKEFCSTIDLIRGDLMGTTEYSVPGSICWANIGYALHSLSQGLSRRDDIMFPLCKFQSLGEALRGIDRITFAISRVSKELDALDELDKFIKARRRGLIKRIPPHNAATTSDGATLAGSGSNARNLVSASGHFSLRG